MNKIHLHNILEQYIGRYNELNDINGNDEGYKWRAESCFKAHWNIDAEDFQSMFKKSFGEMSNLIDNSTVQPVGGILMLLNHTDEIEFVRTCFKELFSEDSGDIDSRQIRIETFVEKINGKIEKYAKGSWKYPQQRNNAIYYMNLWKPEDNYIFKSTEATEWANCIEFGDDFGSGNTFRLKKYYKMCDELLEELKKNEEIMELYKSRMEKEARGFDDQGHILVYDIIYCAKAYNLYKNVPSFQKLSTKERIKLAQKNEKREELLEQLAELSAEYENMSATAVLPDLTGQKCKHKLWGTGDIQSCQNNSLNVVFAGETKVFKYPDSINMFIYLENSEYVEKIHECQQIEKTIKSLENEINIIKRQLEAM
ncbi:MAG: hypothetical protein IJ391_00970 [Clostridia bacterium]|nr:hypothetical protein [Clostridia bacterium]